MGESEERNFIVLASIHYMYILQDYEISMSNIIQFTIKQLSFACNKILPGSQKLRSHKYFSRNKSFYIHKNQSLWNNLSLVKFQIKVFVIQILINKRKIWWRLETTIKSQTVSGSCSITVDLGGADDMWTPGHVHSRGWWLQHLPVSLCQIYNNNEMRC